jgi:hypothetical protein
LASCAQFISLVLFRPLATENSPEPFLDPFSRIGRALGVFLFCHEHPAISLEGFLETVYMVLKFDTLTSELTIVGRGQASFTRLGDRNATNAVGAI